MGALQRQRTARGPVLWPLIWVGVGVALLLGNFLLLGDFNIVALLPLLLVALGLQLLLRGDILSGGTATPFAITRGSVDSATLAINAAEIDISIEPLTTSDADRMIAGHFAQRSRPQLVVADSHASLEMDRRETPWLAFADWEAQLSADIAWRIVVGTSLGQVSLDLHTVPLQNALISTGIGDIHLILPRMAEETIYVRSVLGNITIQAPGEANVRFQVEASRLFGVHYDEARYIQADDQRYRTQANDPDAPFLDVIVSGIFGDLYLI